jgi:S-layer homology domain
MKHVTAIVVSAALAAPCAVFAQEDLAPRENAWGTAWTTTRTVGAWSFVGPMTDGGVGYRDCMPTTGTGACRAALDTMDTGLLVWNLEIEACDESRTEEAVAQLWACTGSGPGFCSIVKEVRTGLAAVPGCARFRADVNPFITVNNYNFTYFIDVFGTNGGANVPARFRGVRIAMLRQVSEAPATATFSDVPTSHPYFRFIEALTGALISGGCGNGEFCPDRPVTRGEMAVFLSVGLGLNFPD